MEDLLLLGLLFLALFGVSIYSVYFQNGPNSANPTHSPALTPSATNNGKIKIPFDTNRLFRNGIERLKLWDNRQANVNFDFVQRINLKSLNDVQKRLHSKCPLTCFGSRVITCAGNDLYANLSNNPEAKQKVITLFGNLLAIADVYLLFEVSSDQKEQEILAFFKDVIDLPSYKFLFCETSVGKIAMVRQLDPQIHLEDNSEVVVGLTRFITTLVHLAGEKSNCSSLPNEKSENVQIVESITTYFDNIM